MENFTYEDKKAQSQILETYEWDNVWWQHAPDRTTKRALIIGNSISCGYRGIVNEMLEGKIHVDGFGTSKAVDNPYFAQSLDLMLAQSNCSLILFNNGLHGYHLNAADYKKYYYALVKGLLEKYSEKKLALIMTTPVRDRNDHEKLDEKRNKIARERNTAAKEIAAELGLDVIDFYELLVDKSHELWSNDTVHLMPEGYRLLAGAAAEYIKNNI